MEEWYWWDVIRTLWSTLQIYISDRNCFQITSWTVNCLPWIKTFVKAELWFWITKVLKKTNINKVFLHPLLLLYSHGPCVFFLTFLNFSLPRTWRTPKFLSAYAETYTLFRAIVEPFQSNFRTISEANLFYVQEYSSPLIISTACKFVRKPIPISEYFPVNSCKNF